MRLRWVARTLPELDVPQDVPQDTPQSVEQVPDADTTIQGQATSRRDGPIPAGSVPSGSAKGARPPLEHPARSWRWIISLTTSIIRIARRKRGFVEDNRALTGSVRLLCPIALFRPDAVRARCASPKLAAISNNSAAPAAQSRGIQPASRQAGQSRGALQDAHRDLSRRHGLRNRRSMGSAQTARGAHVP